MAEQKFEMEATVLEAFPGRMFKLRLANGHECLGYPSGKLTVNFIRILPGDKVTVEVSPYDLSKVRMIWRHK